MNRNAQVTLEGCSEGNTVAPQASKPGNAAGDSCAFVFISVAILWAAPYTPAKELPIRYIPALAFGQSGERLHSAAARAG